MPKTIVAQVGLGNWGVNLFRNFRSLENCSVKYVCDANAAKQNQLAGDWPDVAFVGDYEVILNDKAVEAVIVATPSPAHFDVARKALAAGKHVYVEKPITLAVPEAESLIELAGRQGLKLMVGHLLLYHPAVSKLKALITAGELGDLYYIYTKRLNLGRVRNTENAMWSLAPHDISIILYLMGRSPTAVSAHGAAFIQKGIADVAFLNLGFANGGLGQVHVSWLDPNKSRSTVVAGSKKMAVFDEIGNTLRLFDKGADLDLAGAVNLRTGREELIGLEKTEPLQIECRHFIEAVRSGREPLSNGENGLAVLKVLAAAQRSLDGGGAYELL